MLNTSLRTLSSTTALFSAMLCLSACAPGRAEHAALAQPSQFAADRTISAAAEASTPASETWWRNYGDQRLTALIEEALAENPTLAVAAARVQLASSFTEIATSASRPQIGVKGAFAGVRERVDLDEVPAPFGEALPDGWTTRGDIGAQFAMQLDFFGRNRAAIASAVSDAQAAEMELAAARLQISTAVALSYADVIRLEKDRATAREIVGLREATERLVRQKVERGLENEGQLAQANSELADSKARLAFAEGETARARYALAALLGKGPDRGLDIDVPAVRLPAAHVVPASAGLDLIGRRPDVQAGRLRAEAAAKRIDVARANFYPNITLGALGGFQTLGLDALGGGSLAFGQVGPALSLPIFSGGRLEGAYRAAGAEYDAAVASYNYALALAMRDVAGAISDRGALNAQATQTERALREVETSHRVIRQRYERGLATYIEVLTVENALVAQRRAVANLETYAFAADVALVRALGGGFVAL